MTFTFERFNVDLLKHFKDIPYKYVVDSPKVADENDRFEYLHAHEDCDRCLQIPPEKCLQLYGGL